MTPLNRLVKKYKPKAVFLIKPEQEKKTEFN